MNYIDLIESRLSDDIVNLKKQFRESSRGSVSVKHIAIENFLPDEVARDLYTHFPKPDQMRHLESFRENKYTSKDFDAFDNRMLKMTYAIQHPSVVKLIEAITEIKDMEGDPTLYAGGLSLMRKGQFLNPHLDNSHNESRSKYRVLNLLYYISPDWKLTDGGNLELWDAKVKKHITIPSLFNTFVLMETNTTSWHSVSPVRKNAYRCCISNYYFSDTCPEENDYFNVTSFSARPNQKVRRLVSSADNKVRQFARTLKHNGIGRHDVYE